MNLQHLLILILSADDEPFGWKEEELMEFLQPSGKYPHPKGGSVSGSVKQGLNLFQIDGRQAHQKTKSDESLCCFPGNVFISSLLEENHRKVILGADSFITKTALFKSVLEMILSFDGYWFVLGSGPTNIKNTLQGSRK